MLDVEWSSGEDFTEDLGEESVTETQPSNENMFHGTIDLICSSDEDYDSDRLHIEEPTETHTEVIDVDPEVMGVVDGLVDFVERSLLFPEFGYDPEHKVKEEVVVKREGMCNKPHCLKGCLCSSLGGRFPRAPTHCGKERCIFECLCQDRGLLTIDDENHYTDKSKRKKKLPTRFKDVVLGKAYEKLHARTIHDSGNDDHSTDDECHQMTDKMRGPSGGSSKNPSPELKNALLTTQSDLVCPIKKKDPGSGPPVSFDRASIATVRRTLQERRFGFLSKTLDEEQTLADVQIWCTHHDKYSCLCINYVFFQKTNALIWRPSNASRYLANKVMYDIALKIPTLAFYEVYPYNHNNHSARTHGPIANYSVRNKDEVFVSKRNMEIEHNVLSYSNSYMKFYVRKYPCIKKNEPVPSAEPYDKSVEVEGGMGDIVHMTKTKEKLILDVGKEKLNVKVNYVIDDLEIDEDGEDVENCKHSGLDKIKGPRRKRKPTMKMIQLEEERKREKELQEFDWEKKPVEKTIVSPPMQEKKKRRGRKPKHLVMMERRISEMSDRSTIREPTPEVDIIRCPSGNNQASSEVKSMDEAKTGMRGKSDECSALLSIKDEPSSPDYFSAESRMDMEDAKEEAIVCAPDIGLVASCAPTRTTVTAAITAAHSIKQSSSQTEKDQEEEFRKDIPKPFLGFSDANENPEFEECEDPETDDPDSIHSKRILILEPRKDGYPHSGLVCLTPGFGYITVLESLPGRIVISDPGVPDLRQTFDSLTSINEWLNKYIRSKVAISPPDLVLQWILVKPEILKLKQVKPLDPAMFRNSSIVITPTGIIQKKSLEDTDVSNCSLLRKQLSTHSVFSPLIRQQAAMREAASKLLRNFVSNPKFLASNLVPNPKNVLRQLLKRSLPLEEKSGDEVSAPKVPALGDSSVSFETADGCVTVHRLSSADTAVSAQHQTPITSSSTVFSQVRPPSVLPRLLPAPGLHSTENAARDLEIRHQVTIRPLPNLTKITPPYLTYKHHSVKIHK